MTSEIALDLNRRHFTKARGPLTVIGSWVRQPGQSNWEQCLVVVRTGEEYSDLTIPCIIPLGSAHMWFEGFGDPTHVARKCGHFLKALRFEATPDNARMLAKLVNGSLEDLLVIPPWIEEAGNVLTLGEITLTNQNTGRVTEHLLTDV